MYQPYFDDTHKMLRRSVEIMKEMAEEAVDILARRLPEGVTIQ